MTTFAEIAIWELGLPTSSVRGNKSSQILCKGGAAKVRLDPTRAPFGAGNFNKEESVRMNLDLECADSYKSFLQAVDDWAIGKLAADSHLFFKKALSLAEVKAIYKPSCTPHTKNGVEYEPTMRCKINTVGPYAVKAWTPDKVSRALPECWRNKTLTPMLTVKSVWFMSGACGIVFEIHNIIIEEEDEECPF